MKNVKSLRVLAGHTQKTMAKELSLSETQYRAKENGHYEFTQSEMKKFFEILKPFKIMLSYEEIFFAESPTYTDERGE